MLSTTASNVSSKIPELKVATATSSDALIKYKRLYVAAITKPSIEKVKSLLCDNTLDLNRSFKLKGQSIPSIAWTAVNQLVVCNTEIEERKKIVKYLLVDKKAKQQVRAGGSVNDNILHSVIHVCDPEVLKFLVNDCGVDVDSLCPFEDDEINRREIGHCYTVLADALAVAMMLATPRLIINIKILFELKAKMKTAMPYLFPIIHHELTSVITGSIKTVKSLARLVYREIRLVLDELIITDDMSEEKLTEIGDYLKTCFCRVRADDLKKLLAISDVKAINSSDRAMVLRMKNAIEHTVKQFFNNDLFIDKQAPASIKDEVKAKDVVNKQQSKKQPESSLTFFSDKEEALNYLDQMIQEFSNHDLNTATMTAENLALIFTKALIVMDISMATADLNDRTSIQRARIAYKYILWIYDNLDLIDKKIAQENSHSLKGQLYMYLAKACVFNQMISKIDQQAKAINAIHNKLTVSSVVSIGSAQESFADIQTMFVHSSLIACESIFRYGNKSYTDDRRHTECIVIVNHLVSYFALYGANTMTRINEDENDRVQKKVKQRYVVILAELTQIELARDKAGKNLADITAKIARAKTTQKTMSAQLSNVMAEQKTITKKLHAAEVLLRKKVEKFKNRFEKTKCELDEKKKPLVAEAKKKSEVSTHRILQLTNELAALEKKQAVVSQNKSNLATEVAQLTKEIAEKLALEKNEQQRISAAQNEITKIQKGTDRRKIEVEVLQQHLTFCDIQISKSKMKNEITELKTAIASFKSQIQQQQVKYDAAKGQIVSLNDRHAEHDELESTAKEKERALLATHQATDVEIVKQETAVAELKQSLQISETRFQSRSQHLFAVQTQINERRSALLMQMRSISESLLAVDTLPIKPASGYQSSVTRLQGQSLVHDRFFIMLSALLTQYLPQYFKDATVFVVGNFIKDLIPTISGDVRDKLILDSSKSKPILELPSCVIVPVEVLSDPDYVRLQKMGIIMSPLPMSSENQSCYRVTNVEENLTFFIKQELANLSRASQDILRSVLEKAIFTKDRVVLKISESNYRQSVAEFWYADKNDLHALQANELILVDDLDTKKAMLSFSMIADLLQLGDTTKIADIARLRAWTEKFWNTVEDDLTLCEKHNALVRFLLDQNKLRALKIMYECNILEPMILPDDPKSKLSSGRFNTLYQSINGLQRDYIAKPNLHDKKHESKSSADDYAARNAAVERKIQYLSQAYGYILFFCYPKTLSSKPQEAELSALVNKLKPLFANRSLNSNEVRSAIVTAHAVEVSHNKTVNLLFNPVTSPLTQNPTTAQPLQLNQRKFSTDSS